MTTHPALTGGVSFAKMKERPIIFSGPMVRAILEGRKTQTRRVVKNTGLYAVDAAIHGPEVAARELIALATRCPFGAPGDRLWVREAFHVMQSRHDGDTGSVLYHADGHGDWIGKWTPSIHMPRWASRITLEVMGVRVERLNEITPDDCRAEGQPIGNNDMGVRYGFGQQWEADNGPGSWGDQWVWVVEFRQV